MYVHKLCFLFLYELFHLPCTNLIRMTRKVLFKKYLAAVSRLLNLKPAENEAPLLIQSKQWTAGGQNMYAICGVFVFLFFFRVAVMVADLAEMLPPGAFVLVWRCRRRFNSGCDSSFLLCVSTGAPLFPLSRRKYFPFLFFLFFNWKNQM